MIDQWTEIYIEHRKMRSLQQFSLHIQSHCRIQKFSRMGITTDCVGAKKRGERSAEKTTWPLGWGIRTGFGSCSKGPRTHGSGTTTVDAAVVGAAAAGARERGGAVQKASQPTWAS